MVEFCFAKMEFSNNNNNNKGHIVKTQLHNHEIYNSLLILPLKMRKKK